MADFMGLMKQAAQLQSKMQELQAELDRTEVEGDRDQQPAKDTMHVAPPCRLGRRRKQLVPAAAPFESGGTSRDTSPRLCR